MTPHQSTIHRVLRQLDPSDVEGIMHTFFSSMCHQPTQQRGDYAVAIDGKVQRGRLRFEGEAGTVVHAVSLMEHQTGIVLMQGQVEQSDAQTDPTDAPSRKKHQRRQGQKEKSELAVASRLLQHLEWKDKVLTGDALYCQRDVCHMLRQAGGEYLLVVKANQPQLWKDIGLLAVCSTGTDQTSRGGTLAIARTTGSDPRDEPWTGGHAKHSGLLATQGVLGLARLRASL